MSGADSVSRFKFKRTLEQLAKKEGRGTELISLYVPPDRRIHEVLGQLREELGEAHVDEEERRPELDVPLVLDVDHCGERPREEQRADVGSRPGLAIAR